MLRPGALDEFHEDCNRIIDRASHQFLDEPSEHATLKLRARDAWLIG